MLIKLDSKNHLPTEIELNKFETEVGKLPDDYREFLLKINGGQPTGDTDLFCQLRWSGQAWAENLTESMLDVIYPLGKESPDLGLDLYACYEAFVLERSRIPKGTIPIATDPGGNQYLISLNERDHGHIYFWYMPSEKNEDDNTAPDYRNIADVATSFSEFLNSFKAI